MARENIRWNLTFPGKSPRGMAKAFKDARVQAMREVGETWVKEMLPKHFEEGADNVYKYRNRSKKYKEYKLRKHGHNKPLVLTGALEQSLEGSYRVIAKTTGVTVRLQVPTKTPLSAQRKGEITKVLKREIEQLTEVAQGVFSAAVKKSKDDKATAQSMNSAML